MPERRPDHELLDALRRVARLVDGPLTSAAYQRLHDPTEPGSSTISDRFGTWADALDAADLEPTNFIPRRRNRWRREQMIDAVARWAATAPDTRLPAYAAAAKVDRTLPSPDWLCAVMGGWGKVLTAVSERQA